MKNPIVKVNISDNLESDFKDENKYIEVKLSKKNIDKTVFTEIVKHTFSKIFPFIKSKSSFFKRCTKITETMSVNPISYFKFSLYESLLKNKKIIDKELQKLMPPILQDISKTINTYDWNIYVEYKNGFRGDSLLYFMNMMSGDSNEDYNNMYTIIKIQSVNSPNIKGELIFDEFMCLYDKSNHVDLNNGKKFGTIDLFHSFNQYKLNFTDIRNTEYKYKLLIDHENCGLKEVDKLKNNFNNFIKKYGDCYDPLKNFHILVEASININWRICFSEKYGNVFAGKNEFFSENKLSLEKNSESDIFRSIIELMKYMSKIESADNEKFVLSYDYVDDIIENKDLTKSEIEELFETLELLKY